eukprot:TRINITY_DN1595_c0_g1_i4.p1 TRINITY_DN1595_c0_g1~~TRINITY_DN1595_c0_g1_i4.p1  ORF type:complete len:641 (+),score=130.04 TRINITY_DN1595_c0_g1_i4:85-2007(+)
MSNYYAPPSYVQANPRYNYNPNIYQSSPHYPPPPPTHYPHYPTQHNNYLPPPPPNPYVQQPVYHYPVHYPNPHQHQYQPHHPHAHPQSRISVINPLIKPHLHTTTTTTTTPFNDVELNYIGEKLTAILEDNNVPKPQYELEEIPSSTIQTTNHTSSSSSTTTQTNAQTSQENLNQTDPTILNLTSTSTNSNSNLDSIQNISPELVHPKLETTQTSTQSNLLSSTTFTPTSTTTTTTTTTTMMSPTLTSSTPSPITRPAQSRYPAHLSAANNKRTERAMYKNTPSAGISFPRGRNTGHLRTGSADVRTHTTQTSQDQTTSTNANVQLPPNPMSRHKRNASDGNPARRSFAPFRRTPPATRNHSRTPSMVTNSSLPVEEREISVECSVCLSEYPQSDFYALSCGHSFCFSCTNQHFGVLISSGVTRILCLQGGCGKEVTVEEIASVVDSNLIDKLLRFEKKKLLAGKKNARYCPAVDCGLPVLGDGENKMLTCECGKAFCFDCGENWHEGLTCKQSRKAQKKEGEKEKDEKKAARWKRKNTKPCPRCGISIQKMAGCEFMQCGGCDYHFCWKCLEPHDHFMTAHKHGPRGRKKRIAKKIAYGSAVAVGVAVVAVPALLLGGIAIPALIIGGSIIAAARGSSG